MVLIRPFEDGDNATMLAIEKLCSQGNKKYVMVVDKVKVIGILLCQRKEL